MTTEERTALDACIDALDKDTACRVARLVVECGASVPLAILAVQDADTRYEETVGWLPPPPRNKLTQLRAFVAAWR